MQVIAANWQAPRQIQAITTTRLGGISQPPFNSLNIGDHVNDQPDAVKHNRQLLADYLELPSKPSWLKQTHSTNVFALTKPLDDAVEADGAFTAEKGIVCAVLTADCLPLFITNQQGTKVAILHAGWRGLADGIIEKGIAMFQQDGNELMAYAGPCISIEAFEIGAEVKGQLGGSEHCYRNSEKEGHFYADLVELSRLRCMELGLTQFTSKGNCTFNDNDTLFSYRRDGVTGRMASLIWIE